MNSGFEKLCQVSGSKFNDCFNRSAKTTFKLPVKLVYMLAGAQSSPSMTLKLKSFKFGLNDARTVKTTMGLASDKISIFLFGEIRIFAGS